MIHRRTATAELPSRKKRKTLCLKCRREILSGATSALSENDRRIRSQLAYGASLETLHEAWMFQGTEWKSSLKEAVL